MSKKSYQTKVKELCVENSWDFSLFEKYVQLIEEKNKVMNLTGFSGERLWEEGIYESLVFMLQITKNIEQIKILDIGAGVGFPSIPYVLTKPKNQLYIYEPLQKRVKFLNLVIKELNLQSYVSVYATRAEQVKEKNIFDLVTARAVASIKTLLMSSFHLVKVKGQMTLLKSKKYHEELLEAKDILTKLDYDLEISSLALTNHTRDNKIIKIIKHRSTPQTFPYSWKDIKKSLK
ncbi:16S rRNA (guanine(527)-N(7))-methyltransferase RsmG [Mycoplasmopsis bovirhinis]|uniref:16S rRNA (guanine(527)-N(7))-methyltransferase RsmG n=1 Tax=Mycoplasmopsis bovirhinis TaxID=29553 RepID=UPI000C05BBDF|nr:16S rRNA (guanine(527)-N(7))-methyltransferase RsmG [Mycoplasmopsis bovirhinis]ATO31151.1 16S rRNA (guanine(527)-N(7))-methyltransferase RsmG [Mycoplasmopsis bovirhinis]